MFNDNKEELQRLEAALQELEEAGNIQEEISEDILNEEMLDSLLNEDSRIADGKADDIYKNNYSNRRKGVRISNSDKTEVDPENLSQQLLAESEQKGIVGLVILAAVLTAGILGLAIYWLLRYGGLL